MSFERPSRQDLLIDTADFELSVDRSVTAKSYDASYYDVTTPSEAEVQVIITTG